MKQAVGDRQLLRITVRGVVQGVGFRPFVYQLAEKYLLNGWVLNTSGSVEIEIEGERGYLDAFLKELKDNHPPQAHITELKAEEKPEYGYDDFKIKHSLPRADQYQLISPDLATCSECRSDFTDKDNRRYRYPFTNCTNCGPRFTIIEDIPYDRPLTTMKVFKMCPECQSEYENPLDRRFHAQPNACPVCGPQFELIDNRGKPVKTEGAIKEAAKLLRKGYIVAIRGLGGFLLACDATSDKAVNTLRKRKKRPGKPFAIMLSGLDKVREHCLVSPKEEELIISPASPIVLLNWRDKSGISKTVAPKLKYLGVMLPYTPLHHLLMADCGIPLVMTSGNLSEEPIARDNEEALKRLGNIADYFLIHNRDIYSTYDDSVLMVVDENPVMIRRARGYAPYPVRLPFKTEQVLACGAEEKNTFCITRDDNSFVSQHIGDMENEETLNHFDNTVALYHRMFRTKPIAIARDMHPDYLPSKWAQEQAQKENLELLDVQHHHAHIASCIAENGLCEPVIGVAFDGTGYGTDGNIWGGEFLTADLEDFERKAHFEYLPLPGGEAAVKKPYRTATGYIYNLLGEEALTDGIPCLDNIDTTELELIKQQVDKGLNTPLTSSCGRLFDAVSALTGVCGEINYSAQAAIELEMAAYGIEDEKSYRFALAEENGIIVIKLKDLLKDIIAEIKNGTPKGAISARFHNTVALITLKVCLSIAQESGLNMVALSGGCFQNRRLLKKLSALFKENGFKVITNRFVPPNDGCISLGQAVIASNRLKEN
jgi:hydrogenase maturation protein HypF